MPTLLTQPILAFDRALIDSTLSTILPSSAGSVAKAMCDATLGEGQRLRPLLSLRIARAFDVSVASVIRPASAVELLHCASLIVDDLPCMDDAPTRRNRDSIHIRYGEANAVLAAFGLVALAARSAADNSIFQSKLLCTLSCESLIGGQALDLELTASERRHHNARIVALKTVPLFVLAAEAAILHPSIGPADRQSALDFAREFGISYQMVDDLIDGDMDDPDSVDRQVLRTRTCLNSLPGDTGPLEEMLTYLNEKLYENGRCSR